MSTLVVYDVYVGGVVTVEATDSSTMGRELRAIRMERHLKPWQVGAALEMSGPNWTHYETGRNKIAAEDLPRFAKALGIPRAVLIRRLGLLDEPGAPPATDGLEREVREVFGGLEGEELARLLRELRELPTDEARRSALYGFRVSVAIQQEVQRAAC